MNAMDESHANATDPSVMTERILFLEPVGGIAGDMFLAAAIDLGVDVKALESGLRSLALSGWRLDLKRDARHSIGGMHLTVSDSSTGVAAQSAHQGHNHRHEPAHHHEHEHAHGHDEHAHRSYVDIDKLIEHSQLPERAKARSRAIFRAIGEVEAQIHNTTLDKIHFHEVGAVDSIIDICGAALVLELLGNPTVYCAPPPLGSGTVRIDHGVVPVPVPATLALLRGLPVRFEGQGELTTPTGAALVKVLTQVGAPPPMVVERIGYGLGTKDFAERANVLRMTLGHATALEAGVETLDVLECSIDDCTPQVLAEASQVLLDNGALDVWVTPVLMKKGRAGHLLGVLARPQHSAALQDTLYRETSTIGVRRYAVERHALERRFEKVTTAYGEVTVKVATLGGKPETGTPEFEECKALARAAGVSTKHVIAAANAAWWSRKGR
jgi:pyridinium-3,5-bisthiocarboxylic acid mononucleotide nickel chelatase